MCKRAGDWPALFFHSFNFFFMNPIANCETIEIALTAGQGKYKFPSNTNFTGKACKAIEMHRVASVSKSPLGSAVCNEVALLTASLIMNVNGKEAIKDQPAVTMSAAHLNGGKFEVENLVFSLDKSSVNFGTPASIVTGEVILLTFYW